MTLRTLVARSLRFYWRTHLGLLAGCALSATVLVGALFVGDSVRESLEQIALQRLGTIEAALDSGERYFRSDLPKRMAPRLDAPVAAALRVDGMALLERPGADDPRQVNRVNVLGVDEGFLGLAQSPLGSGVARGRVFLGRRLADALGAEVGDEISLRIFKPSLLPRDAPLATSGDRHTLRRRFLVSAILGGREFGRFSLTSDQESPHNAFVDLAELQELLDWEGRANVLAVGVGADPEEEKEKEDEGAQATLRGAWSMRDAGLATRRLGANGPVLLHSERIYLDPAVVKIAFEFNPDAVGSIAYLVDEIATAGGKSTPYSFMAGISPGPLGPVPADMAHDEILVNRWLADRLSLKAGDRVTLRYSVFTARDTFEKQEREFRVRAVLEMEALKLEKEALPEFPGLTDVENCADWEIQFPTDKKKLEDKANEEYWDAFGKTPKAIVTLAAGQAMWGNRYGNLMTVRYPADTEDVLASLGKRVDPREVGLILQPVRENALAAVGQSMDLGQLFLGMSFFLIAASLILTGMLFVFTIEQRAQEMGVLLASGYTPAGVRTVFLAEGGTIALIGSLIGVPLGWGFARGLIWGLGHAWSGAVADAAIAFHATGGSAAVGALAGTVISILAMGLAMWKQAARPVRQLVAEDASAVASGVTSLPRSSALRKTLFLGSLAGAGGLTAWAASAGGTRVAPGFFGAGALLLVAGIVAMRAMLARLATSSGTTLTVATLGVRNAARRPGRGLATAAMLACGSFIVLSVSAMKEDLSLQAGARASGTGGFELYGESTIPVVADLDAKKGRDRFGLTDAGIMDRVSIIPLKVRRGDDASCRNLNQALTPPLVGVDPERLAALGAFAGPEEARDLWALLDGAHGPDVVPAVIGDSATAVWKLKKSVDPEDGDLLDYFDEQGRAFRVKLVGAIPSRLSVLQGRLLISREHFTRLYPSEAGARAFLVDVDGGGTDEAGRYLTGKLSDIGMHLVPSVDRLREFYDVESAYLSIFMALGGLGLLLGTAGMGILVLRNVMERRGELAVLRAIGYTPAQAAKVVSAEHRFLLAAGLVAGTVAAAVAMAPSVTRPGVQTPYGLLGLFLVGTALLSLAWIRIAAWIALRTPLVPALRNE